jgi:hypothetical protein
MMEAKNGHEYGVMIQSNKLPVPCDFVFTEFGVDQIPAQAHKKLDGLKKVLKEDHVIFCLRCSDHPQFGDKGKKPLAWWIDKLAKHGFEYHETYSQQLCAGTDWFGIIVCRVKR